MVRNRLGANSLLSAIYGGMVAGPNAVKYIEGLKNHADAYLSSLFDGYVKQEQEKWDNIMSLEWYRKCLCSS